MYPSLTVLLVVEKRFSHNLTRTLSVRPELRGLRGGGGAGRVAYRRRLVTHFHAFLRHFLSSSSSSSFFLRELHVGPTLRALNADRLSRALREWTRLFVHAVFEISTEQTPRIVFGEQIFVNLLTEMRAHFSLTPPVGKNRRTHQRQVRPDVGRRSALSK